MNTPLTPEQSALLEEYARQCRARFIQNPGTAETGYAINHPEQWEKNHAMSVHWQIQQGEVSWLEIEARVRQFDLAPKPRTGTPSTPPQPPSDCVVLPCLGGLSYFRRSAIVAIFPANSLTCTVQTVGDGGINDHATVNLPAPEVAELVFGKLS